MISFLQVFLDSNVVFSAVSRPPADSERMWPIPGVDLLPLAYVIEDVSRHLHTAEQRAGFRRLLYRMHLVPLGEDMELPESVKLSSKDVSRLRSALAGKADLLVPGDDRRFYALVGTTVQGVLIDIPTIFRARYPEVFHTRPSR